MSSGTSRFCNQAVMDQFKQSNPNPQADGYQEKQNQIYKDSGELYRAESTYQKVLIEELKELFASFGVKPIEKIAQE